FLENLTDDRKRNQARKRLRDGFKFSSDQVNVLIPNQRSGKNKTINLVEGNYRIAKPPKSSEEEIIREITKRILQNRYRFSEDQVNALFSIQKNESKTINIVNSKRQSLLSSKDQASNETIGNMAQRILRDNLVLEMDSRKRAKANRIDYPDEFTLESVKERLDDYDVSTSPDLQALADVIIMLCIRPAELITLRIINAGVTDYGLIPKYLRKLGAVYAVVVHEAENMAHAYTIAGQALRYNPDNHTSPVQNYVIVNYRPCNSSTSSSGIEVIHMKRPILKRKVKGKVKYQPL
ncbi:42649_t:CDS:2, partial [Gigaspora margarita]